MDSKSLAEYGSWTSDIDAKVVYSGNCKAICELQCSNDSVFWIEQQFPTGRRSIFEAITRDDGSQEIIEWTPDNYNVKNAVHEYGGGSFIIVDKSVYFTAMNGVFRQSSSSAEPELITIADSNHRFADLCHHNGVLYAVYEVHSGNEVENMIVKIENDAVQPVVTGSDFYAFPRVSPNGEFFSWMEWNMPNMPWDETSVCVASLCDDGTCKNILMKLSHRSTNFHCPEWSPNSELLVISDQTNWWNLYKVDLIEKKIGENVFPAEEEIGGPLWQFADRQYASNSKGILLNVGGKLKYKQWDGATQSIDLTEYSCFKFVTINDHGNGYAIASGPKKASSVLKIDLKTMKMDVIREARSSLELDQYDISVPESVTFDSDDSVIQAWFYKPLSKRFAAPGNALPPAVLMAHGGPTARTDNSLDMKIQYLTSRGFAVMDVNYRGSTGFGTVYRNYLKRSWGVVDRNDMINAAKYLVQHKMADPKRLCIIGSSAGGFLLLATVLHSKLFTAAASLYGVSDLVGLAKDTHKFEMGYNEQLLGKYPEEEHIYKERSPIEQAEKLSTPVAFFHGEDDPVVPLSQSVALFEEIKTKGLPTALTVFQGESHGFKGFVANKATLDGFYYFFCRVLGIKPSVHSTIDIVNLPQSAQ